ncbi:alkaline phosphatase family protein [Stappia sp.]|uniref:alkaline phosphatase family protein n=1 Tax=Stappia sp. TaxID=1870903 RepID=UPI003A99F446
MAERHRVIVVGIDGLRPDMVNAGTMPNLAELRGRGAWCANHRTVFPSETRGALTALSTGAPPAANGVLGNQFFARGKSAEPTQTHLMGHWQSAERQLHHGMVTVLGLPQILSNAGKRLAVITSSGQGSLAALNWKGGDFGHVGANVRHPQISFPRKLAASLSATHGVPLDGCRELSIQTALDVFTRTIWREYDPDVAIIWLTEADSAAHRYGLGDEGHLVAMRQCDSALGRLMEWRMAQPDAGNISLLVTSDHGHVTISGTVSVRDELNDAGFKAGHRFGDGVDILVCPGRAAGLWFANDDPGHMQEVFDFVSEKPWFGGAFSRCGSPGAELGTVEGTISLRMLGVDHPRSPDLYINLGADGTCNTNGIAGSAWCDVSNYEIAVGCGTHGGLHRDELSCLLLAEGERFKTNATNEQSTGICDVAPTILELLGVAVPTSMSGRVINEIMADEAVAGQPEQVRVSATRNGRSTCLEVSRFGYASYFTEGWAEAAAVDGQRGVVAA